MKLGILLIILFSSHATYALDINKRASISKEIIALYQKDCQHNSTSNDDESKVKGAFELAAIYIAHGEHKDMREQLLKAKSITKDENCRKSIDTFLD